MLKPGFFLNEELAKLDPLVRILFQGLWCIADREGRLEDRPPRIKAAVLPYDELDTDKALTQLASRGFITRYECDGKRYIEIPAFLDHQTPHSRETAGKIPSPDKAVTRHDLGSDKAQPWSPVSVSVSVPVSEHNAREDGFDRPVPRFPDIHRIFESVFTRSATVRERETLKAWGLLPVTDDAIRAALTKAHEKGASAPVSYAATILVSGDAKPAERVEWTE